MKIPFLEKIIKYGLYATAFISLIIFSQYISPFHFGKAVVFRSLVEILAVFYVILLIKRGNYYLPPRTPLFWTVTLFTVVFGLTTLTSVNLYQSFFGSLERMGGWFSFLHMWGFFVMATALFRKKEEWLTFIKLSLFASLLSAFYGFLQKTDIDFIVGSGGRSKIFGTLGNSALFAGYMIVNAFLALTLFFKPGSSGIEKKFYALVFLIDAFAVFLTGVRGSVLALVVGAAVFGFLYAANFGSKKVKNATLAFVLVVILSAAILFSLRNLEFVKSSQYLARYSDISPKTYTVQTRVWAWQAGFDGWTDSARTVLLGWGPENFNIPFSKNFNPNFFRGLGSETLFDRAHNQFLEVLFTMGLAGFAAYILMFFYAFKALKNLKDGSEHKIFKIGLVSALVAYMIHNSFIFDTTANYIVFFMTLGFVNFLSLKEKGEAIAPPERRQIISNTVGLILLIAAIFSIYKFEITPARANFTTTRAILASWSGNHDLAFEKFKEAMSFDTPGKYEIRHRYNQYILERATSQGVDEKTKERLLTAIENTSKNAEESAQDYLPYLYLSRSYILLGTNSPDSEFNDLALENSFKALEISPTFVRTYYEIAQAYLNKKDFDQAIEWFEKVVELNPEVSLSHWYLGITYAQKGEFQKGVEIIENSDYPYTSGKNDALRMLNIYLQLGDFGKISEIYEALIKLEPRNPQYYASLAVAYGRIGEIDKAVQAARTAAQLDPSFAAEAEAFIRSLR